MKCSLSPFLILSVIVCAAPQAFGAAEPLSCADRSVTARAVRTTEDVKSFVQCAYEFAQEVGFAEARRAFHEEPCGFRRTSTFGRIMKPAFHLLHIPDILTC